MGRPAAPLPAPWENPLENRVKNRRARGWPLVGVWNDRSLSVARDPLCPRSVVGLPRATSNFAQKTNPMAPDAVHASFDELGLLGRG
jgi:hypothetical protein